MELKDFIENFAAQFDDTDASEIKAETTAISFWQNYIKFGRLLSNPLII